MNQNAQTTRIDGAIDHLVYAAPELEAAVESFAQRTGVRPTAGGRHVGRGTRNALVALGTACYLELIGPDPDQPTPDMPRPFGIDHLAEPRLVTWAVKAPDLEERCAALRQLEYDAGEIREMSRATPTGEVLSWRLAVAHDPRRGYGGVVPFLIDWGPTPSPAETAAAGCRLLELCLEHEEPRRIETVVAAATGRAATGSADATTSLGIGLRVVRGPVASLSARIAVPNDAGEIELT